jgi:membrane-associated phospholipid phosphatase
MLTSWVLLAALAAQAPVSNAPERSTAPQTTAPTPAPAARSAAAPDEPSPFTHLFQNLGDDAAHLVSRESGVIVLGGFAGAAVAHRSDASVAAWVLKQPSSSSAASVGNTIGGGWIQAGAAVGTWAAGALSHDHAVERVGADLIRAQVLNEVITESLKVAVNRDRPNGGHDSFPSGHTSATFATAAILQSDFGWGAGAAAYALGGFVAWSRVRSNNHWLSDVVSGGVIGILSGRAVARGHHGSNWAVTPVKTAGGGGVYVTIGHS